MPYKIPDSELMKFLTPKMREDLTSAWLKANKEKYIASIERTIASHQEQLSSLKAIK